MQDEETYLPENALETVKVSVYEKLGPMLLGLIGLGIAVVLLIILYIITRVFRLTKLMQIFDYLYHQVFWNAPFRYLMESYLSITLTTLSLLATDDNLWADTWSRIQTLFSSSLMALYVIAPIAMTRYFVKNINKF